MLPRKVIFFFIYSIVISNIVKSAQQAELDRKKAGRALIGRNLNPSQVHLRTSPLTPCKPTDSDTYCRSNLNSLTKGTHFIYPDKNLKYGQSAHMGDYMNLLQYLGDRNEGGEKAASTSAGKADLHDQIINYKLEISKMVAKNLAKSKHIEANVFNSYPCIMVHIKNSSIKEVNGSKKISEAAHEAWVDFLISYYLGLVNFYAHKEDLSIELERRSSFGFLTPTIAPTGRSFRISLGIVPKEYAAILTKALRALDAALVYMQKNEIELPEDLFYNSEEYLEYLGEDPEEIDDLSQILFAKIDRGRRTGAYNIVRSAYARHGISKVTFNEMLNSESTNEAFVEALTWAMNKLTIKDGKLTFNQKPKIEYKEKFSQESKAIDDPSFWELLDTIAQRASSIENKKAQAKAKLLQTKNISKESISGLYSTLEELNEIIFIHSIARASKDGDDDGYGSESDIEGDFEEAKVYSKKIITHNGMRAIWAALLAAADHLGKNASKASVYLKQAYYEVELGFNDFARLHDPQITLVKSSEEANIIFFDLNACITDGKNIGDYTSHAEKILILDSTSATTKQIHQHIQRFAASRAAVLFLVDSGIKHQQLGADKNQYGTIRIITRNKKNNDLLYEFIVTHEKPLLSMISHTHRRLMKNLGMVPTTSAIFDQVDGE